MRTNIISNTTVTYPNEIVWLNDSNVINLESSLPVGASIVVANPLNEYKVIEYLSDLTSLTFKLDDILLELHDDSLSPWYVKVIVYENGYHVGTFNFAIKVINGRSFLTRSHGMSQTMYVYNTDELNKVEFYSVAPGNMTIDQWGFLCYEGLNAYNLSPAITGEGEHMAHFLSSNATPSTVLVVDDQNTTPTSTELTISVTAGYDPNTTAGGDIWADGRIIFPKWYKIIYQGHCTGYNFAELRYTDTDGCTRYLGGTVISEEDSVPDSGFSHTTTEVYKLNPSRFISEQSKVVKIAFNDIEKDAYPADILYSNSIQMRSWNGEWKDVRLKTDSLAQNDDEYLDFELEVYTHEQ